MYLVTTKNIYIKILKIYFFTVANMFEVFLLIEIIK